MPTTPELELEYIDSERWDERAALFTENAVFTMPGDLTSRGRSAIRAEGEDNTFAQALENRLHDNEHIYRDGETIIVEGTYRGRHVGTLRLPPGDLEPTNRAIAVPYLIVYELSGDLIAAKRAYFSWHDFARPAD